MIYLAVFLFSGLINIAFWISLPGIIRECIPGDEPFIFLGGFADSHSDWFSARSESWKLIGLLVHYLMFRDATKND